MTRLASYILRQKAVIYASKIFLASVICWYSLSWAGVANPIWSVITVLVVSDPNLSTTLGLSKVRAINTIVGCAFGITSIFLFGYSPLITITTAALTVLFVNGVSRYPANWRLAPVTVVILMDAGRLADNHAAELYYAWMRVSEIAVGCIVALGLAGIYTKLAERKKEEPQILTDTE